MVSIHSGMMHAGRSNLEIHPKNCAQFVCLDNVPLVVVPCTIKTSKLGCFGWGLKHIGAQYHRYSCAHNICIPSNVTTNGQHGQATTLI